MANPFLTGPSLVTLSINNDKEGSSPLNFSNFICMDGQKACEFLVQPLKQALFLED